MKKLFSRASLVMITSIASSLVIIYFATLFGVSNWLPNAKIVSGQTNYTLTRLRDVEKYSDIDVLFLGSSLVYRALDPRPLENKGIETFNLGTSAQTPYNSYFLLKEHMPELKPDFVVLDLYWNMVCEDDPTEPTIDIVSNHQLTPNIVDMAVNTHDFTIISSLASNFISRLHTPLSEIKDKELGKNIYVKGGYLEPSYTDTLKQAYELSRLLPEAKHPAELQVEYINKIISLCRANNINLVFIMLPVSKELKSKVINYRQYKNFIATIAKKNNLPFIDYNERKGLSLVTSFDFLDENHLSKRGASKVTKLFMRDLDYLDTKDKLSSL